MKRRCLWFALALVTSGCNRRSEGSDAERNPQAQQRAVAPQLASRDAQQDSPYAVNNSLPGIREPHVPKGSEVTELLTDATSAFRAGLAVEDDTIYLLTDEVVYRLVPGSAPERIALENGVTAGVTRAGFIYWSKGALFRVPKTGGKARHLAALPLQPQYFIASGEDFAWVSMPERERFLVQTFDGNKIRTLHSYDGRIEAAALDAGRVFFVERSDASWRIGSIAIEGGEPTYAAPKLGQAPAKLAVAGDVHYYDVKSNAVVELSRDLKQERPLTHDLICSPLAVSVRIYCPNMEGMFELARHPGAKIMPLFPSRARIAAVAASEKLLVWLDDAGRDRLSLKMIRLELDDPS